MIMEAQISMEVSKKTFNLVNKNNSQQKCAIEQSYPTIGVDKNMFPSSEHGG
jgi:hypothetical protein